jgi:signal transduction histidine kinase
VRLLRGAGECADWATDTLGAIEQRRGGDMIAAGKPQVIREWADLPATNGRPYPCTVVLPVAIVRAPTGALVMVGDARDPFGALDETFLVALGRQIGSALAGADLTRRLRERGEELARLSTRMVRQHEEERRRLSRELHDETAQVFSVVKLQLGVLKEQSDGATAQGLARALDLVDTGIRSIRNVTETLRPAVLDELGLVPALRSLAADTSQRCGLRVEMETPTSLPPLTAEAELALFRAMQESLSNVVRHAHAHTVHVGVRAHELGVELAVRDDGRGMRDGGRAGGMGLAGMRERIAALGGQLSVASAERGGGTVVRAWVPALSA